MDNVIITIGREFGSGGRELGRRLAEALGFDYYDKEIVKEIAKKTSYSEQYVQQIVENNPHDLFPITIGHSFSYVDAYALSQKQNVFNEQENVIKEMASKSNCVIVGRCADYILKDLKPFKIFVYADMKSKVARCLERKDETIGDIPEKKMVKYIKKIDKKRRSYYEFYTGKYWGDKLNYDLMVNTSSGDIKQIVTAIASMLKNK